MEQSKIDALKTALNDNLLRPGDPEYDDTRRVWNGMIDRKPAFIARCRGTADARAAVNFAREHGLPISVRGGGHNVAGAAVGDDSMMIDLSPMRAVVVDARSRVARVQGGALLEDLDRETQVYGLATPTGMVSQTGIAGLCLSGGVGWLRRKHGLTCDNLVGAEVVTGNGDVVHTSETENPELLWGLRGGGGNFGVVTTFEFRLHHPVGPEVFFTFVAYPADDRRRCYEAYREFTRNAPADVTTLITSITVPDVPEFPVPAARGRPAIAILGVYAGPAEQGEPFTRSLRDIAEPLFDFSGPMPWRSVQSLLDPNFPKGGLYYWKGGPVTADAMSDAGIDKLVDYAAKRPSPLTSLVMFHMGGAVRQVAENDTAYSGRAAEFIVAAESSWTDRADSEANIAWARDAFAAFEPYALGGLYLNYPGFLENQDRVTRATFGPKYERLQALKKSCDPDNLFRFNSNISPA